MEFHSFSQFSQVAFSVTEKVGTHTVAPTTKEGDKAEEEDDDEINIDDIWAKCCAITSTTASTHSQDDAASRIPLEKMASPNVQPLSPACLMK